MTLTYWIAALLALLVGGLKSFGIGANDAANPMATSVGARALSLEQAVRIGAFFALLGAIFAGSTVTSTVRKGIIPESAFASPDVLVVAMLAALLAGALWLLLTSWMGLPVSTTHSIVGALIGVGIAAGGFSAVEWGKVFEIAASWVTSPFLAGAMAFALGMFVKKGIMESSAPLVQAKRYVPYLVGLTAFMISSVMIVKGLKHVDMQLSLGASFVIAFVISIVIGYLSHGRVREIDATDGDETGAIESVFRRLMIATAAAMAFSFGSNDLANALGPLAAIFSALESNGEIGSKSSVPFWLLLFCAAGIGAGIIMFGQHVIKRVGETITKLTPSRGFVAELCAASTVVSASLIGMPISTTHTLVGAVIGVGLVWGIKEEGYKSVGGIFVSWVMTLIVAACTAATFFAVLSAMML